MSKRPEKTRNVSLPCSGRWVWNKESNTLDFVSCRPPEEAVLKKRRQTNDEFHGVQQRAEWLADMCTLNHRGRQSIRKSLSSAHLTAYVSSVMKRRGDRITMDHVKQVAVSLLQENYSLPIPFCFVTVLKSKKMDDLLAALLLYLSCFFEHKSQEKKSKSLLVFVFLHPHFFAKQSLSVDIVTESQKIAEAIAKQEIAKKKLAVCYFSLFMDVVVKQHQKASFYKGPMSNTAEWLLDACLYSFFCYVAWVAFGREDIRDIQEEIGRLLYSDTFNMAVMNTTDGDLGRSSTVHTHSSLKMEDADPKQTGCDGQMKERMSRRGPALSSVVNQRSPLMVSLFPSPKERSPHLFLGSRARRQSPLQAEHCDTKALTEQLNQQLASVSFGILGKSLKQFNSTTLIPHGEEKNPGDEAGSDLNNSEDDPGIQRQGSCLTFTVLGSYRSMAHNNTANSEAMTEVVTLRS